MKNCVNSEKISFKKIETQKEGHNLKTVNKYNHFGN